MKNIVLALLFASGSQAYCGYADIVESQHLMDSAAFKLAIEALDDEFKDITRDREIKVVLLENLIAQYPDHSEEKELMQKIVTVCEYLNRFLFQMPRHEFSAVELHSYISSIPNAISVLEKTNGFQTIYEKHNVLKWTPLHMKCASKNLEDIELLLQLAPNNLSKIDALGNNAFHIAIKFDEGSYEEKILEAVQTMLESDTDLALKLKLITSKNLKLTNFSKSQTPLEMAKEKGFEEVVTLFADFIERARTELEGEIEAI